MNPVLTVEEGGVLGGKTERIDELYEEGVRLMTLTWNYENCIGSPNSANRKVMRKGLKPFGIRNCQMRRAWHDCGCVTFVGRRFL